MVQPRSRLVRCIKFAAHAHTHPANCRPFSSQRDFPATTPLSVAHLISDEPVDNPGLVVVNGFIRSIRKQKHYAFASIGDGSSLKALQAVLAPHQAESLSTGTAVRLTGTWKPSPNSRDQSHELHIHEAGVEIIGTADPATFPLQKKYHSPEFLRTIPHLRTRVPFNSTLLRFRSDIVAATTQFFAQQGYTQTHTPIITSSDCEGAGEVFTVETAHKDKKVKDDDGSFFRSPKYLTVSSQLHLEALAQSVGNVWTLSPTFRAEKSDTSRHLSEFYMLEAELGFVDDMNEVMDLVEKLLRAITKPLPGSQVGKEILASHPTSRAHMIERRWHGMTNLEWPCITYTHAIKLLEATSRKFDHKPAWGLGLQAEHERFIAEMVGEGKTPVFITKYPKSIKPFYMLPSSISEKFETVDCFDIIVPEVCEIVGGSMREHRLEPLITSMQANGMIPLGSPSSLTDEQLGALKWYIDLRRWGSIPHGGFGLGFDRLLGYLAGVENIREIVTFPRWVGRCGC
ncbi:hypothetical protein G7Y89_g13367 [Cudoniella acicularis]|uniref:asparagine--tRNA ligase n=1 Tax=Cudoniella acicularis TaxID=354080 RepID=A0A8H4R7F1_9HELO|nr:hypothetical protein G7Y89_g13367 [Cudoniella acicularis]